MDNYHQPLLTSDLAEAALLEQCVDTALVLLPNKVIWVLLAVKVYGSLTSVYKSDFKHTAEVVTIKFTFFPHFRALLRVWDWDNQGDHLKYFKSALRVWSEMAYTGF